MAKIRRLVLDTLKPHEPNIIDLAHVISELDGVSAVNISIYELDRMVGASRQLLLWNSDHFSLVRHFLKHYELPPSLYQMVLRSGSALDIKEAAIKNGFKVKSQNEAAGDNRKTPIQLDTLRLGADRDSQDKDRCALITKKNSDMSLHSSYELTILFLSWALGEAGLI